MCGIVAVFGDVDEAVYVAAQRAIETIRHRGPDDVGGYLQPGTAALWHCRLSIMDPGNGSQPMFGADGSALVHNGEIYNWRELRREIEAVGRIFNTLSDSEVILHLFETAGATCAERLDGDFTFAVVHGRNWLVARDPIGVKPLYYGQDDGGRLWFASELKAIQDQCLWYRVFPPGHSYSSSSGLTRYYKPAWLTGSAERRHDGAGLRGRLQAAIEKRLMTDVPLASLLSGGLDSSLVTAIAARLVCRDESRTQLPSFSIGVDPGAPDLEMARQVAAHAGTDHHEVLFTPAEGIAALSEVIRHFESYDVAEIRGSVPMYFLIRAVRVEGVKVVLSGEGADDVFGGYLYFHFAEDAGALDRETVDLVTNLHLNDLQRVDKISMAHGVEARVPYLDQSFLDLAMTIDPELKLPRPGRMEKWLLRAAFDDPADPLLPPTVLWRQKEQFDDGVGYRWVDELTAYAERTVSDRSMSQAAQRFAHDPPITKEGYLYRELFEEHFPAHEAARNVVRWVPRWQPEQDSSGRANEFHTHPWTIGS